MALFPLFGTSLYWLHDMHSEPFKLLMNHVAHKAEGYALLEPIRNICLVVMLTVHLDSELLFFTY